MTSYYSISISLSVCVSVCVIQYRATDMVWYDMMMCDIELN